MLLVKCNSTTSSVTSQDKVLFQPRSDVVARASASQSVELGSSALSSHVEDLKCVYSLIYYFALNNGSKAKDEL